MLYPETLTSRANGAAVPSLRFHQCLRVKHRHPQGFLPAFIPRPITITSRGPRVAEAREGPAGNLAYFEPGFTIPSGIAPTDFSTSFVKKNFPSVGTIMICTRS